MRVYSNRVGFTIRIAGQGVLQCNRRDYCNPYHKKTEHRPFKAGKLHCNCNFHLKMKAGKFIRDAKGKSRHAWNDSECVVTIVHCDLKHTGGCEPCPQQHVMTKSRAGKYVGDISTMSLFTLCNTASRMGKDLDTVVSTGFIRMCFLYKMSFCISLKSLFQNFCLDKRF